MLVFDSNQTSTYDFALKDNSVLEALDGNLSKPVALNYQLHTSFPNPFNSLTTIPYSTPEPGKVRLQVYDLQGRLVKDLIDQTQDQGLYQATWDGANNQGQKAATGIYFVKIRINNFSATHKIMLIK